MMSFPLAGLAQTGGRVVVEVDVVEVLVNVVSVAVDVVTVRVVLVRVVVVGVRVDVKVVVITHGHANNRSSSSVAVSSISALPVAPATQMPTRPNNAKAAATLQHLKRLSGDTWKYKLRTLAAANAELPSSSSVLHILSANREFKCSSGVCAA